MGAPTWPPTPDEADKATLEEYGDAARAIIEAESDEEAEEALLAHFLMGKVQRQLTDGSDVGLPLEEYRRPLEAWVRMATGLDVAVAVSDPACTDTRDLYLPRAAPPPERPDEDRLLYRCMALVQAGLLHLGLIEGERFLAEVHGDWVYRNCYHLLATRLIIRHWSDRYPGVAADFEAVRYLDKAGIMRINLTEVPRKGMPAPFLPLYDGLVTVPGEEPPRTPDTRPSWDALAAVDRLDLSTDVGRKGARLVLSGQARRLREHFRSLRLGPPPLPYFVGVMRPEWILDDLQRDLAYENEWRKGNKPLRSLLKKVRKRGRPGLPGSLARAMRPGRVSSPVGGGPGSLDEIVTNELQAKPPRPGEDGELSREYDEWNNERSHYVVAATRVREDLANSGPVESYQRIVAANQPQINKIRRQFAALRLEERWLHGQQDGTEIDMNRAVSAMADIRAGFTPKVDWYIRFQRQRQDVAIMVLVDLSGSTQGSIIYKEQEALVLFSEGLRVLDFPHAFYGFNGTGPRDCMAWRIKDWDEPYDVDVFKRLGNLRPAGATRLGAFIRHGTWHLSNCPQERRILMVISDGKPEDKGQYRGSYGVKDTAMAVHEARRVGVHVHCISLDPKVAGAVQHGESDQAEAYLRDIFGSGKYLVCDEIDDLPVRLPEVFRSLVK